MNRFSLISYNIDNTEEIWVKGDAIEHLFSLSLQTKDSKDVLRIKVTDPINDCRYQVSLVSKDFLMVESMNLNSLYWLKLLLSTALSNFKCQKEVNKLYGYDLKCEILVLKKGDLKLFKNIDDLNNWDLNTIREQQKEFENNRLNHPSMHFEHSIKRTSVFQKLDTFSARLPRLSLQPKLENETRTSLDQAETGEIEDQRGGLLLVLSVESKKENMKFEIGIQIPTLTKLKAQGIHKSYMLPMKKSKKDGLKTVVKGIEAAREYESFDDVKKKLAEIKDKAASMARPTESKEIPQ